MKFLPVFLIASVLLIPAAPAKMMKKAAKPGTPEFNQELARSFVENFLNGRDPAAAQGLSVKLVATDYRQHNPMAASYGPGRDGLMKFLPAVLSSFPDAHFTLRDLVANKDHVTARWTFRGTLTGEPFLGVAAKGQKVEFDGMDEWTVKDGQLFEHWDAFDWVRLLAHLGTKEVPPVFQQLAAPPSE